MAALEQSQLNRKKNPITLRDIADDAELGMADVAFLANLSKSTLSRLWDKSDWLDRVSGQTLKQLISAVPGIVENIGKQSYLTRLEQAIQHCEHLDLQVRSETIRSLIKEGVTVQRVIFVLEAAVNIMQQDMRGAAAYLARCWGPEQNVVLDALLASPGSSNSLIKDNSLLIAQSVDLTHKLSDVINGLTHTTIAHGILVHKLTKISGDEQLSHELEGQPLRRKHNAFAYRSATIGKLLGADNREAGEAYRHSLQQHALLRANELWSFATYSKDISQTPDFTLPRNSRLEKTARDIVQDVWQLNEAYLWYLASTALPVLLAHDNTFGGKRQELAVMLAKRCELGLEEPVSSVCTALAVELADRRVLREVKV